MFSTPGHASASTIDQGGRVSETSAPTTVSDVFVNFIDMAFANLDGFTVLDPNGVDVSKKFVNTATKYYNKKDYQSIQNMIDAQHLSISVTEVTPSLPDKNSDNLALSVIASTRGENVSKYFYHKATDKTTGKYKKDWTVCLSGSFTYLSSVPYTVISASGPTLSLVGTGFGAGWSPYFDKVSTSHPYSGNTVKFSATYNMRATTVFLNIVTDYDFGTYTDSFTAYPSVLQ